MSAASPELEVTLHRIRRGRYPVELRIRRPDSDAEEWLIHEVVAGWDGRRTLATPDDSADLGRQLTATLFGDAEPRRMLGEALAAARALERPLRLRLRCAPGAERLHGLAWEAMLHPESGRALATSRDVLFSRVVGSRDWRPVQVRPLAELRALVVIASPAGLEQWSLTPIDVETERQRALAALGRIPAAVLASPGGPTQDRLLAALQEGFDILYLACHGAWKKGPRLWLERADGRAEPVDGRAWAARLAELERRPALVVLASCQSAANVAALGPLLAAAGIPAVVGMHSQVSQETAFRFTQELLRALEDDGEIDRAVAVARRAVEGRGDEWMPVLFLRFRDGRLWEEHDPRITHWLAGLDRLCDLGQVRPEERRALLTELLGSEPPPVRADLLRRLARTPGALSRLGLAGGDTGAGEGLTPATVRREQILAALRWDLEVRVERLGIPFILVPPGRSPAGTSNEQPFHLAAVPVSEAVWAEVLEFDRDSASSDRVRVDVNRSEIEKFLQRANRRLEGDGVRLALPAPQQLRFALETGGSPSALGLRHLTGVIYQLCREANGWVWWGGGHSTPEVDFRHGVPSLPSRSAFEQGEELGFRPILHLQPARRLP